jgi:predicted transcriptional regulator
LVSKTTHDMMRLRKTLGSKRKDMPGSSRLSQFPFVSAEGDIADSQASVLKSAVQTATITNVERTTRDVDKSSSLTTGVDSNTLKEAALMKKQDISEIPFLGEGQVVGRVHESTSVHGIVWDGRVEGFPEMPVYEFTRQRLKATDSATSIIDNPNLLFRCMSAMPVPDEERIAGIITKIDALSSTILSDM